MDQKPQKGQVIQIPMTTTRKRRQQDTKTAKDLKAHVVYIVRRRPLASPSLHKFALVPN